MPLLAVNNTNKPLKIAKDEVTGVLHCQVVSLDPPILSICFLCLIVSQPFDQSPVPTIVLPIIGKKMIRSIVVFDDALNI